MKKSLTQKLTYVSISLFCILLTQTLYADQHVAYVETSACIISASIQTDTTKSKIQIYEDYEQMPEFPGGEKALLKFLEENTQYPEAAKKDNIEGRVTVEFAITETGEVAEARIIQSLSPECDKEALRVANAMPKWIPGRMNDKPTLVYYLLPITFKQGKSDSVRKAIEKQYMFDGKAFRASETMPGFPGGELKLLEFLNKNTKFPRKARRNGVNGTVMLRFIVSETGEVADIEVIKPLNPDCDAEAIRVVNAMPKWKPGEIAGEAVPVYFSIPFQFRQ